MNQFKNICLALSIKYTANFLKPFLKSFEQNVSGTLYLITDLPEEEFKEYSKVKIINFNDLVNKYNINPHLSPFNLKPVIFYLLLKNNLTAENVLISDTDVIFQSDPFTSLNQLTNCKLILCEEKKHYPQCPVNSRWLEISYPEYILELENKKILNSGVVYGPKPNMISYLKAMINELQTLLSRLNYPILDQIILNILFYVRQNIKPILLAHNNPYIIHLSQEDENNISQKNIINNILTLEGFQPSIVHQYNKQPFLNSFYTQLYV